MKALLFLTLAKLLGLVSLGMLVMVAGDVGYRAVFEREPDTAGEMTVTRR